MVVPIGWLTLGVFAVATPAAWFSGTQSRAWVEARTGCESGEAEDCYALGHLYRWGKGVRTSQSSARAAFERACEGGSAAGCSALGTAYQSGNFVPEDASRATAYFELGCGGGDAFGCMAQGLASLMNGGTASAGPFARAARLFREACESGQRLAEPEGERSGCSLLGSLYEQGWGVPRDFDRAVANYERGCAAGCALGCRFLGNFLRSGTQPGRDPERAAALYEQACEGGDEGGCWMLGSVGEAYLSGTGVAKDVRRAAELLARACESGPGSESYCATVARLYESGSGVARDRERAAQFYQRACVAYGCEVPATFLATLCDSGTALACTTLARLHERGDAAQGVTKDPARVAALLERACQGGSAPACLDLSKKRRSGIGVPPDGDAAARLVEYALSIMDQACEAGEAETCYELARSYAGGADVPEDEALAATLFTEACDLGWPPACKKAIAGQPED